MDRTYDYQVDITKSFDEQKMSEKTKAIFANIFRDYWATDYQRERILAKEKQNIKNEFEEIYKYQQFLLFGKRFRVVKSNVTEATILEDMFIVPQKVTEISQLKDAMKKFTLEKAKTNLPAIMSQIGSKIGICPAGVRIKSLKSKWGSCDSNRMITFNSRLIQLEPKLIEYVVVHELCHVLELNHSERFWKTLEQFIPDWAERRRSLKRFEFLINDI